jgi:hypothetical protein
MSLEAAEAGLLFLGIQQGWSSSDVWMQSPVLRILREVDGLLFCHLRRIERLAVAYKSFKLLKVRHQSTCLSRRRVKTPTDRVHSTTSTQPKKT